MKQMVVYLSGPISLGGSSPPEEREMFTRRFKAQAERLRAKGYAVIDPTECPPQDSWEDYMRHGMVAVADADMIAVLPRWEESRGARLEVFVARELRIPVHEAAIL